MKRSVNFTGRKPMKAAHVLNIASWLGMSEAEQRVVFGNAPLFVNLNGEETVEASIRGGVLHCQGRTYGYDTNAIHLVDDGAGLSWYEINDTALASRPLPMDGE